MGSSTFCDGHSRADIEVVRLMDHDDDMRVLVRRAAMADADAWEAIFRRSHPRLVAFARRRTSSIQAAEDAVSETMVRALQRIDRFRWDGAGFDAWLVGILRNVVFEGYRSDARYRRDVGAISAEPGVDEAGPLDALMIAEEAHHVRLAFARLTPEEQELLELRVVAGLSSDGAAHVLGKKPGTIRMAQARALDRLRVFVAEEQR